MILVHRSLPMMKLCLEDDLENDPEDNQPMVDYGTTASMTGTTDDVDRQLHEVSWPMRDGVHNNIDILFIFRIN